MAKPQQPDSITEKVLLTPGMLRGFATAQQPLALPQGTVALIQDSRLGDGTLRARWGDAAFADPVNSSFTIRGIWEGYLNGVSTIAAAYGDGSQCAIVASYDHGLTWNTLTVIMGGPYGDTYLSDTRNLVVSAASNASPIVITTTAAHGFNSGDTAVVASVGGNTAANGTWIVTYLSPTTFSLNGSTGNSAYTSGGTVKSSPLIVHFAVFRDTASASDLLIIQNGYGRPRVFGPRMLAFNGSGVAISQVVPQVPADLNFAVYTNFTNAVQMGSNLQAFVNSAPTKMKMQDTGTATGFNFISGNLFTTYDAADTSVITFNAPLNISGASQVVLSVDNYSLLTVSAATNASPIAVTTATAHNLQTGETTVISDGLGNTAVNGKWTVTVTSDTQFTLNGSVGNGAYTANSAVATTTIFNNFWQYMRVTLVDGTGNTLTLYDPTAATGTPIILNTADQLTYTNLQQIAYPFEDIDAGNFVTTNVTKVAFQWAGGMPPAEIFFGIYMFAAGGTIQGTTSFAASYNMSDARALGPSQIYGNTRPGPVSFAGGPNFELAGGTTIQPTPTITDDDRFFFDYFVTLSNTSAANRDLGINQAILYANYPGETGYYLVNTLLLALWTGSAWTFTSGSAGELVSFDANFFQDQDFTQYQPGADALTLPIGTSMLVANGHAFVLGGSTTYFSDFQRNFLFRLVVQPDLVNGGALATSGGSFERPGETFMACVALGSYSETAENLGSPTVGSVTIYLLTNFNLFSLTGYTSTSLSRLTPVGPHGTLSPYSLARDERGFYWLDQRGQICFYGNMQPFNTPSPWNMAGGPKQIGIATIDDQTLNVPYSRKQWVTGACANNRYYFGYSLPGQTTNQQILVFYERLSTWESIDLANPTAEFLLPHYGAGGYVELLRFSAHGLVEHEQPNNTNNVSLEVIFAEFSDQAWTNDVAVEQMTFLSDVTAGAVTYTLTRFFPAESNTVATTIAVTGAMNPDGVSLTRALAIEDVGVGDSGQSVQPSIAGTVPGGTRLYMVRIQVRPNTSPSDARY